MKIVTSTLGSGWQVPVIRKSGMVKELKFNQMEYGMRVHGKMIRSMDRVL